jgi:hypothetical protein
MARRHPYFLTACAAAVLLAVAGPVASAQAASYQYALKRYLGDYSTVSSAIARVAGGKGQFANAVPGGMRMVVQTYSGSTLLYTSSGISVSFTHGPVNDVQSRCYWYYTFGPVGETIPVNCWRYA